MVFRHYHVFRRGETALSGSRHFHGGRLPPFRPKAVTYASPIRSTGLTAAPRRESAMALLMSRKA